MPVTRRVWKFTTNSQQEYQLIHKYTLFCSLMHVLPRSSKSLWHLCLTKGHHNTPGLSFSPMYWMNTRMVTAHSLWLGKPLLVFCFFSFFLLLSSYNQNLPYLRHQNYKFSLNSHFILGHSNVCCRIVQWFFFTYSLIIFFHFIILL